MQGFVRRRYVSVGLVTMLLVVAAVVVLPALADPPPPDTDLNLHTNADGVTQFRLGSTTQPVENAKGCLIKDPTSGPLVALSSTNPNKARPGYVRGIGLKTGGSNGTPCSQVDKDDAESLVLTSRAGPWERMELDLELKQNAKITIAVSGGGHSSTEVFTLNTGSNISPGVPGPTPGVFPYVETVTTASPSVDCANPSDSGPDSGPNDNCRLIVLPDETFDTVTITALVGAVSLEGGADFVAYDAAKQAAGDYDSIFVYAPVATDDTATTNEDTPVTIDVLANDATGATLDTVGSPSSGKTVANTDGTVTFDPNGDFEYLGDLDETSVTFTYVAEGVSGVSSQATVTVTIEGVNDPPEVDDTSPDTLGTDEDTSGTLVVVATDAEGQALVAVITDGPTSGTLLVSGTSITYTPDLHYFGGDSFSYEVCEVGEGGLCSDPQTVTVWVNPVNDPPVAVDDGYDVDENHPIQSSTLVVAAPGVLHNDDDIESSPLTAVLESGPSSGTLVLNADGSFRYTPDVGFVGSDSFQYRASDGTDPSVPATVTIEVVEVMCTDEPQDSGPGHVFGEFTLLSAGICKRYLVIADEEGETVTFSPDGVEEATFRGLLRFPGEDVDGSLPLLEYDPDGVFPFNEKTMPVCEDPVFVEDQVTSATIPGDPGEHTWCLVRVTATANDVGELVPTYEIYGKGDPIFRVR